jgi:DNA modification methylase
MIITGDCLEVMKTLENKSVQTCITSPPYWGLRDYGVDGQMGLENTPEEYVAKMVEVFREVRRVLRDDGTLWLNLGDSYGSVGGNTHAGFNARYHGTQSAEDKQGKALNGVTERTVVTGLATKNLLGIPWRVAFALQADGWTLRQDIIWHKPNPMPESVTDRCTKAHEYIFLMSKSQKYHYDADAIKEEMIGKPHAPKNKANKNDGHLRNDVGTERMEKVWGESGMANKRSVWTVSTRPFKEAHFATFPPQLIEPCVKAGSKAGDTILDPFSGAGTTGLVAFQHEREFIGIELNPEYAEIATRRIEHERSLTPLLEAIK